MLFSLNIPKTTPKVFAFHNIPLRVLFWRAVVLTEFESYLVWKVGSNTIWSTIHWFTFSLMQICGLNSYDIFWTTSYHISWSSLITSLWDILFFYLPYSSTKVWFEYIQTTTFLDIFWRNYLFVHFFLSHGAHLYTLFCGTCLIFTSNFGAHAI